MTLDIGVQVKLAARNDKAIDRGDGVYRISAVETHGDLTFYRLCEVKGALFLASSLEIVR